MTAKPDKSKCKICAQLGASNEYELKWLYVTPKISHCVLNRINVNFHFPANTIRARNCDIIQS